LSRKRRIERGLAPPPEDAERFIPHVGWMSYENQAITELSYKFNLAASV